MRREVRRNHEPASDWQRSDREDVAAKVGGLGDSVALPGTALDESRRDGTGIALLAGDHGKVNPTKNDTVLDGKAGAHASGVSTFNVRCVVKGIDFKEGVTLGASANVIFQSCVFRKPVTVESGGKASFTCCRFIGTSAVDNSASATAANIGIIGCVRTSGVAHQFATIIFEAT